MPNFDDRLIEQSERLYTVRPRSAAIPISAQPTSPLSTIAGDRGSRARIRLLSSDTIEVQKRRLSSTEGFSTANSQDYITGRLLNRDPGAGFSDFLLTSVNVAMTEKVQITQTFGDGETVYYFGKAPIIFNLGGLLIDDLDNQWFTTFVEAYTHIIRGTELARNYELVEIELPNMIIIGTVMGFTYQQDASRDTDIQFSMQVHAKEVRPLPVQIPAYAFTPEATVISFKKAQELTNFLSTTQINKILSGSLPSARTFPTVTLPRAGNSSVLGTFGNAVSSASTTLSGFRASLFSPVFGVLTSITKVVKTTTGDISKIISSFTNPVNNILRDIQGIAGQAIAVATLIQNSVNDVVNIPLRTLNEVRNTIIALRNAAGVISRVPESIAESIKRLTKFGNLKTSAAFLTKNGAALGSKTTLLNSGAPYSPKSGATLGRR